MSRARIREAAIEIVANSIRAEHWCTDIGNAGGGYDCVCGEPWLTPTFDGCLKRHRAAETAARYVDALGPRVCAPPKRRNRASAKSAGSAFETLIAGGLAAALEDDRIERRVRNGIKDRGDVTGVRAPGGGRLVIECKDYGGEIRTAKWTDEAEVERGHDDALAGLVVAKRMGTKKFGDQYVLLTMRDLVAILTGHRNHTI